MSMNDNLKNKWNSLLPSLWLKEGQKYILNVSLLEREFDFQLTDCVDAPAQILKVSRPSWTSKKAEIAINSNVPHRDWALLIALSYLMQNMQHSLLFKEFTMTDVTVKGEKQWKSNSAKFTYAELYVFSANLVIPLGWTTQFYNSNLNLSKQQLWNQYLEALQPLSLPRHVLEYKWFKLFEVVDFVKAQKTNKYRANHTSSDLEVSDILSDFKPMVQIAVSLKTLGLF